MIDSTDLDLVTWAEGVLPGMPVALDPPGAQDVGTPGVGLYLLELRQHPPMRSSRPEPLRLWARYLVHAWAPLPAQAHEMLFELAFSALEREDLDVDLEPPAPDVWFALGVAPRPCFRVGVPVRRTRVTPPVKPVLHPLVARPETFGAVGGWVRTPDDQPIFGAWVGVPSLGRSTVTDHLGRFELTALPGIGNVIELRTRAKGREVWTSVAADADRAAVVIRLDPVGGSDGGVPHP